MPDWTPEREAAALARCERFRDFAPPLAGDEQRGVDLADCIAALRAEREARQAADARVVQLDARIHDYLTEGENEDYRIVVAHILEAVARDGRFLIERRGTPSTAAVFIGEWVITVSQKGDPLLIDWTSVAQFARGLRVLLSGPHECAQSGPGA